MSAAAEKKSCTCPVGGCALRRGRQPDGECAMERTQRAMAGAGPARPSRPLRVTATQPPLTGTQLAALTRVSNGYRNGTPVFAPSTTHGTRELSYTVRRQLEGLGLIEQYDHAAEMHETRPNVAVPPFLYFRTTAAGRDIIATVYTGTGTGVEPRDHQTEAVKTLVETAPHAPLLDMKRAKVVAHRLRDLTYNDKRQLGSDEFYVDPAGMVATPFVAEGENVYGFRISARDGTRVFMVVVKEVT